MLGPASRAGGPVVPAVPGEPSLGALAGVGLWLLLAAVFLLVARRRAGAASPYEPAGWVLVALAVAINGVAQFAVAEPVEVELLAVGLVCVLVGVVAVIAGRGAEPS